MIVVDIESTGLDSTESSIVSIGAVDLNNPTNQFYGECRIFDGAYIDPVALKINGFTLEQINDAKKMSLEQLMKEFISWSTNPNIKSRILAGHNVGQFDFQFLLQSAKRYSLKWPFGHRVRDLHTTCLNHIEIRGLIVPLKDGRTSNVDSTYCFNYVGLPDEPEPHNALTGAKMAAEALSRLIYGKKLLEEFREFEVPSYLQ